MIKIKEAFHRRSVTRRFFGLHARRTNFSASARRTSGNPTARMADAPIATPLLAPQSRRWLSSPKGSAGTVQQRACGCAGWVSGRRLRIKSLMASARTPSSWTSSWQAKFELGGAMHEWMILAFSVLKVRSTGGKSN